MAVTAKMLTYIGLCIGFVGFILSIVALATDNWLTVLGVRSPDVHMGLFNVCTDDGCVDVDDVASLWDANAASFYAVRAFAVLTTIVGLAGFAFLAIYTARTRNYDYVETTVWWMSPAYLGCSYVAFMCSMIAIGVFRGEIYDSNNALSYLDYSYFMCTGAGILMFIGADLFLYAGKCM